MYMATGKISLFLEVKQCGIKCVKLLWKTLRVHASALAIYITAEIITPSLAKGNH